MESIPNQRVNLIHNDKFININSDITLLYRREYKDGYIHYGKVIYNNIKYLVLLYVSSGDDNFNNKVWSQYEN